ncbi:MAG: hypothetical protein J5659_03270 [Clostridia bacterium]|nr:hypothetical protein [Clostridia bacterium]
MIFNISVAGINIGIESIYDAVYEMCSKYITDSEPDFVVSVTGSDIDFERQKSISEAKYEGRPCYNYAPEYLETLAVYRKIATGLLYYEAFLMHGSAVALDGKAYVFTAPSGVGKTTHTGFWLAKYPDAFVINGDKPIIRFINDRVFVCGTPWSGKEQINTNAILPLKAVCVLFRGEENLIEPIEFKRIFPLVLGQIYRPSDRTAAEKTLSLLKKFGESVEFYTMNCNLDPDAARVAKEGMNYE